MNNSVVEQVSVSLWFTQEFIAEYIYKAIELRECAHSLSLSIYFLVAE